MEKVYKINGMLDKAKAASLVSSFTDENLLHVLDFQDVEDIQYSALRLLMNAAKSGRKIRVTNAKSTVAEKFEDTGVSHFVNVCRCPKPIDLSAFDEFGGGFLSKSFNNPDGDSMIKYYTSKVEKTVSEREKFTARAVLLFGIPTPLVGPIYSDGKGMALEFERIEGKRSLSRVISEEPERMEEMTVKFAKMCLELHNTPCDTSIFPDKRDFYRDILPKCDVLTPEEVEKVRAFIDSVPDRTTCLHGDMQLSNVITTGTEEMWIDLSDFSYGDPMLDLGMWYFLSCLNPDGLCQHIFHLSAADMHKIWEIFAREYFGADTPEKQEEARRKVEPYAALHMLYLGLSYGFEPGMVDFIKSKLI